MSRIGKQLIEGLEPLWIEKMSAVKSFRNLKN